MKYPALAATFVLTISAAHADSYKLSADQQVPIFQALMQLDGYDRVIKGKDGKDEVIKMPYTFPAAVRLSIARDLAELQSSIKVAQDAVKTATTGLADDKAKAEVAKIAAEPQPLDLRPIDLDALAAGDNPVAPSVLALIMPIAAKAK